MPHRSCGGQEEALLPVWRFSGPRKKERAGEPALKSLAKELLVVLQQWHDQQRHDIDDLDERIDRRAGGILVRVADGVAGHGRLVRV